MQADGVHGVEYTGSLAVPPHSLLSQWSNVRWWLLDAVPLQDALFSRGTSATPDLPSAGKPRLPRGLFSPAQHSGSASAGKVAARRGLLHGGDVPSPAGPSVQDCADDHLGSQPSGEGRLW